MSDKPTAFVTGATGMVGSHLVERLVSEGYQVRALVRETSHTRFLEQIDGVELFTGDLAGDADRFKPMVEGMEYIFHIGANVDDWGDRDEMVRINVDGLRHLMDACDTNTLKRFVFVGSMAVLGMGTQDNLDESAPYVHTGDNYNYTKIEAETLAMNYAKEKDFPIVVIRPPYIYGPRDRQFFPRVCTALRDGIFKYIGDGNNPFELVYALNVVEALLLAATKKEAVGQLYMITDGKPITRRELVELICDVMGYDKPEKCVPAWLAKTLCPIFEFFGKLKGKGDPPLLNRFKLKFMYPSMTFNITKAKKELGYGPPHESREALRKTLEWFKENHPEMAPGKSKEE
ncbi:MAG: NAD-dependent epimerase/dehydratase family protein [Planctomycetes bacterium]|nr:NAD-dependent epimerase/dehydratase family protein [Planctomycetota bacterium]